MTGREALEDIRRTNAEVDALLAYRNSLLDRLIGGYDMTREHVQEQVDSKVERSAIRWLELTEQIDAKTDEFVAKRDRILGLISMLSDRRSREVLTRRYAESQDWDKVAELMRYSRQRIWQLHRKALEEFEQIYGIKCRGCNAPAQPGGNGCCPYCGRRYGT
jgi:DNA-directed RNA polymerase specialized sigma subunit